jgi:hypothetical protein
MNKNKDLFNVDDDKLFHSGVTFYDFVRNLSNENYLPAHPPISNEHTHPPSLKETRI